MWYIFSMKKYGPYLILIAGATLSIAVAFISIRAFKGTGGASYGTSTDSAVSADGGQRRLGFFESLRRLTDFNGLMPRTPRASDSSGGESTTENQDAQPVEPVAEEIPGEPLPVDEYYYGEKPSRPPLPEKEESELKNIITLDRYVGLNEDPDFELMVLRAAYENYSPVLITGMTIESAITRNRAALGTALPVYFQNKQNSNTSVFLKPGEYAYIITGDSPLNYSFKVNKCVGYLEQYDDFYPSLNTYCPLITEADLPVYPNHLNDNCLDYIPGIPQCYEHVDPFPENINLECQQFILKKMNYSACVSEHIQDPDFYTKEWRLYLNRDQPLWKTQREHIRLKDQSGNVIDEFSY